LWVTLQGAFDHSGATPMGLPYRRDANLALGHIIVRLDELVREQLSQGKDLVQTIGVINSNRERNESRPEVYYNAVPKISGYAYFSIDARSVDEVFLKGYLEQVRGLIDGTAREFGVS